MINHKNARSEKKVKIYIGNRNIQQPQNLVHFRLRPITFIYLQKVIGLSLKCTKFCGCCILRLFGIKSRPLCRNYIYRY